MNASTSYDDEYVFIITARAAYSSRRSVQSSAKSGAAASDRAVTKKRFMRRLSLRQPRRAGRAAGVDASERVRSAFRRYAAVGPVSVAATISGVPSAITR